MSLLAGMFTSVIVGLIILRLYSRYYYVETTGILKTLTPLLMEDGYSLVVSNYKGGFLRGSFTVRITVTENSNVRNTWVFTCYGVYHYRPPFYPIELALLKIAEQSYGDLAKEYGINKLSVLKDKLYENIFRITDTNKRATLNSLERVLALAKEQNIGGRLNRVSAISNHTQSDEYDLASSYPEISFTDCVARASNDIKQENNQKVVVMKARKPKKEEDSEYVVSPSSTENVIPSENITTKYPSLFDDSSSCSMDSSSSSSESSSCSSD